MAASIWSRERLCGGSRSGATAPIACQGLKLFGSWLPVRSPPNARSSGLASDLKINSRMTLPRCDVTSLSLSAVSLSITDHRRPLGRQIAAALPSPSRDLFRYSANAMRAELARAAEPSDEGTRRTRLRPTNHRSVLDH